MESWRKVWREGMVPQLSTAGLEALGLALATDDPRLLQGATTSPPPLMCVSDWPVDACCAITFAGWQGGAALTTVAECEEHFARVCYACDQSIGEPAACRWFLNWFDDEPRNQIFPLLLEEVRLALAARRQQEEAA